MTVSIETIASRLSRIEDPASGRSLAEKSMDAAAWSVFVGSTTAASLNYLLHYAPRLGSGDPEILYQDLGVGYDSDRRGYESGIEAARAAIIPGKKPMTSEQAAAAFVGLYNHLVRYL
jgi:hypothetical protein